MDRDIFETEHDAYRESVGSFIVKDVVPHYADWERAGIVPRDFFVKARALGAFAAVPEEYGGAGNRDFRYNAILNEQAAYAGVGPAFLGPGLQADICMPYLLDLTSDEHKAR